MVNLASFALILPGCGLAGVVLGFAVLTTTPLGTLLWNLVVALTWLPVALGVALGAMLSLVLLLIRFPLLLPVLLCAAGLASVGLLCSTAGLWWQDASWGGGLIIALGLLGTALALAQLRRTTCRAGG